ncbi:MAG: hypothetical protein R3F39_02960 [Myxococcota bacterium]
MSDRLAPWRHLVAVAALLLASAACGGGGGPGAAPDGALAPDTPGLDSGGDLGLADAAPDAADPDSAAPDAADPDAADPDAADEDAPPPEVVPSGCPPDQCDIDGVCHPNEAADPDNACVVCLVVVDPTGWTPKDGAICGETDDACTIAACVDGECVITDARCDDGDPCTHDTCQPEIGCVSVSHTGPCDDGDACTVGSTCATGACAGGEAIACPPAAGPCAVSGCDPGLGCVAVPVDGQCDDGDPCTTDDHCAGGLCVGAPRFCGDFDACTADYCDAAGACQHVDVGHLCADQNPCTDDACDRFKGCVYPPNNAACDDQNACTTGDVCVAGLCRGTPPAGLDDGNPCTTDLCDPAGGVQHVPNTLPCEDGTACTVGDVCAAGVCVPGAVLNCGDSNPCTDDACDPAVGCVNAPNDAPCTDKDPCTKDEVCAGGACSSKPVSCNDGDPCTTDYCKPGVGCKYELTPTAACRPAIEVLEPARAATLQSATPSVRVRGSVSSGAGEITGFTLNGAPVPLSPSGAFDLMVDAEVGGNALVFVATDAAGQVHKRVQSFTWSTTYYKPAANAPLASVLPAGIGVFYGQQAADDGVRDVPPDDLGTIAELIFRQINPADLEPGPITLLDGLYEAVATRIDFDIESISVDANADGLVFLAAVKNLRADLEIRGLCVVCPTVTGELSFDTLDVDAPTQLYVDYPDLPDGSGPDTSADKVIRASLSGTTVTLSEAKIQLDGDVLDFLLGDLLTLLANAFRGSIEGGLAGSFTPTLVTLLSSALRAFRLNFDFNVPSLAGGPPMRAMVRTRPTELTHASDGIDFHFDTGVAPKSKVIDYDNLGVPRRVDCDTSALSDAGMTLLESAPIEFGLKDDVLNAVFYSLWMGGLLEFELPDALYAGVDMANQGVTDLVIRVSGMSAPTLDDCDGVRLAIGDLRFTISMSLLGQPATLVVYVSLEADLDAVITDDGLIQIGLSAVTKVDAEVEVVDEALLGLTDTIDALVSDTLIPSLIVFLAGEPLAEFPLPALNFNLGDGVPSNSKLTVTGTEAIRNGGTYVKALMAPDLACDGVEVPCPEGRYCLEGACVSCTEHAHCQDPTGETDQYCTQDTSFWGLSRCVDKQPSGDSSRCEDAVECVRDYCIDGFCRDCLSHADCQGLTYCLEHMCVAQIFEGLPCKAGYECQSGQCGSFPEEFCYTPDSKGYGVDCKVQAQCTSGQCLVGGTCGCGGDHNECGPTQYCGVTGACGAKQPNGVPCLGDVECLSNTCAGVCLDCVDAADCGENQFCELGACKGVLPDNTACTSAAHCQSGYCNLYCYTPSSVSYGGECRVMAQCKSGQCLADNTCGCKGNAANCGGGQWCDALGYCHPKASDGTLCAGNTECQSGKCGPFGESFCYTPASKSYGQGCKVQAECQSGQCLVGGTCGCKGSDANCGSGKWCDIVGSCHPKSPDGGACAGPTECQSGACGPFGQAFCYTPASKDYDQGCKVGAECKSGQCLVGGTCGCAGSHANCAGSSWCDTLGSCQPAAAFGTPCLNGFECASTYCAVTCVDCKTQAHCGAGKLCAESGKCYTPNSKTYGQPCVKGDECKSGQCLIGGTCGCNGSNGNCAGSDWCDALGSCQAPRPNGGVCTQHYQCENYCKAGFCQNCATDAHCSSSQFCNGAGNCEAKHGNGWPCVEARVCSSDCCVSVCVAGWVCGK